MSVLASSAPASGHLVHALLLAAWIPVFAVMAVRDRRRAARVGNPRAGSTTDARLTQTMAIGCVSAAVVHGAVMPDHFSQSWLYGTFFVAIAMSQVLYAGVLLVRPTRALVWTATIGSGLVIAFWLYSRLVGVPVGPDNGGTEPFGPLDIAASIAETLTLVAGLVSLARSMASPGWRLRSWSATMRSVAAVCIAGSIVVSVVGPRS